MGIVFEQMVSGLAKPGADIVASMTPEKAHLMHMAVGVAGEVGELLGAFVEALINRNPLDLENVTEELGDAEFYLEGLRQGLGFNRADTNKGLHILNGNPSVFSLVSIASVKASELLDSIKKGVIYNKPLDLSTIEDQLLFLDVYLFEIYREVAVTRETAIEANIAKLGKRYEGHNYSDEAAQNRADKN